MILKQLTGQITITGKEGEGGNFVFKSRNGRFLMDGLKKFDDQFWLITQRSRQKFFVLSYLILYSLILCLENSIYVTTYTNTHLHMV